MAKYTITTTQEQEDAISLRLKIDNGKLLEQNRVELNAQDWVQAFFSQQMQANVQQVKTAKLNQAVTMLAANPDKLDKVVEMLGKTSPVIPS